MARSSIGGEATSLETMAMWLVRAMAMATLAGCSGAGGGGATPAPTEPGTMPAAATETATASAPPTAPSTMDCRKSGCPLGDTCVSPEGCGHAWVCEPCATGIVMEESFYCGCDGVTFSSHTVGCQAFEFAHRGRC